MFNVSNISTGTYKVLLIAATAIWGCSFVVMKGVLEVFPPALLLGIRFTMAGLILLIVLRKRVRESLSLQVVGIGALLAVFDFSAFLAQTAGLQHTTAGINAFLTATYCVIVPFVWWLVSRKRPSACNTIAAFIALIGIWLVAVTSSGSAFTLGIGEGLTEIGAVLFAMHLVLVARFAGNRDALVLTVFQFLFEGLFGLTLGGCFETAPALSLITPEIIGQMAFLIVFASVIAFGIQNVSLAHVPPAQVSLFLSLESVFGVIFSVLLTGEVVTARLLIGFALIFGAILMNELLAPRLSRKRVRAIVSFKRKKRKEGVYV